jgi:hypothetical protein
MGKLHLNEPISSHHLPHMQDVQWVFVIVHYGCHMDLLIFLAIFMKRLELIIAKGRDGVAIQTM